MVVLVTATTGKSAASQLNLVQRLVGVGKLAADLDGPGGTLLIVNLGAGSVGSNLVEPVGKPDTSCDDILA